MLKFYIRKVTDGTITIDEVPVKYRQQVKDALGITDDPEPENP